MKIGTMRAEEAIVHNTHKGYHSFHAEKTQGIYGSFEVFYRIKKAIEEDYAGEPFPDDEMPQPGWYWWSCFPGCLPDSEASGPFATSRQALQDADEWNPEFDE